MEKVPGHGVGRAEEMPGRPARRPIIRSLIGSSIGSSVPPVSFTKIDHWPVLVKEVGTMGNRGGASRPTIGVLLKENAFLR